MSLRTTKNRLHVGRTSQLDPFRAYAVLWFSRSAFFLDRVPWQDNSLRSGRPFSSNTRILGKELLEEFSQLGGLQCRAAESDRCM